MHQTPLASSNEPSLLLHASNTTTNHCSSSPPSPLPPVVPVSLTPPPRPATLPITVQHSSCCVSSAPYGPVDSAPCLAPPSTGCSFPPPTRHSCSTLLFGPTTALLYNNSSSTCFQLSCTSPLQANSLPLLQLLQFSSTSNYCHQSPSSSIATYSSTALRSWYLQQQQKASMLG